MKILRTQMLRLTRNSRTVLKVWSKIRIFYHLLTFCLVTAVGPSSGSSSSSGSGGVNVSAGRPYQLDNDVSEYRTSEYQDQFQQLVEAEQEMVLLSLCFLFIFDCIAL